jgi:hypothetical protein
VKGDTTVGANPAGEVLKQEAAATLEEVRTALDELWQDDTKLARIQKFAELRIKAIGYAEQERDRTADDLIQEAIQRTLALDRVWRKSAVDLCGHLLGVIRSISSHWAEQHNTDVLPLSSFTEEDSEGDEYNPVEAAQTRGYRHGYRQRDEVEDRELVEKIERAFQGDSLVTQLMECIKSDMKGPEIQAELGISKTEYETGMKRMRRKARLFFS